MGYRTFPPRLLLTLHLTLATVVLLLSARASTAQPTASPNRPLRLTGGARVARVPLRVRRNLLLVPVTINGRGPWWFVLDTGVETAILTDPAVRDSLRLPPGQPLLVEGAGEDDPLRATYYDSVRVTLPGVAPGGIPLTVLSGDALQLSRYVGEPVAGLIGYDIFRAFVVEVRGGQTLLLHDPARFRAPRRTARLPLTVRGGKPYVRAQIRQTTAALAAAADSLTLLLDTGAGHALSLETGAHPALHLPDPRLRAQLGRGLSGAVNGWLGRVAALELGPYRLTRPLVSFPDSAAAQAKARVRRDGTLGYETLKRFRMWVDYPGRGLWLRPDGRLREPFEHDMSGMDVVARGPSYTRYVVAQVQPESPAAEAGLLPDDELLSIDGRPTNEYSLTTLSQLLHSRDGRPIQLLIRRGSDLIFCTLVLKRVI